MKFALMTLTARLRIFILITAQSIIMADDASQIESRDEPTPSGVAFAPGLKKSNH